MSRFITTKADFTLRRKHKTASGATVYETDYTTITPKPNAFKNEYVIGDSNFKFTTRLGINGQKKHTRGKFVPNPMGDSSGWTLDTIIDSGITEESRIRLKPNYTSIRDFACYGSAAKLVQGTLNGVFMDFPAEIYFSVNKLTLYETNNGYTFNPDAGGTKVEGFKAYNEYGIDITNKNILPESVYNPLRFFTLCGSSYNFIDVQGNEHEFVGFDVTGTSSGRCTALGNIEIDGVANVGIRFADDISFTINVYQNYSSDEFYYTYNESSLKGCRIRPKKQIIEDYFRNIDDFTAVLLNRETNPIYLSTFQTPRETDEGIFYDMINYVWPALNGGFNPDLSGGYFNYADSLMSLGMFYDEYFTDNAWRSLTHEAIKNLDWTYVQNTDGDLQELTDIDTSRIEPITRIYGRQFDDLKRYADGIKSINTITYNKKSNTPDYTLTDILENSGWETKVLHISTDKDLRTESLYSGLRTGYTSSDTDSEFLRRLKLNSRYIFSTKGTRKGLDTMLSLFGFESKDYDIHEYVCVFSGKKEYYTSFCNDTDGKEFAYPLAKDVATINKYKINYDAYDPYTPYCGIPVAEIGYSIGGEDYSYVVPWFSQGKKYDDGLYFQMNGGWGRVKNKKIELDIAPQITAITENPPVLLYSETQARLKFANDFDDMLQEARVSPRKYDVFYVTDISKITDEYAFKLGESRVGVSHYFILETPEMSQFLGFSTGTTPQAYGWRNIKDYEINFPDIFSAGTLVLYLESIPDDTTGNNPHTGNGYYDDGAEYIDRMSNIFGYSTVNKNFIGIDDTACDEIKKYKFDVDMQEDNRKCWFFSDDYNVKYGKKSGLDGQGNCTGETITFLEADITDGNCELYKGKASSEIAEPAIALVEALGTSNTNKNKDVKIGISASSNFQEEPDSETNTRPSDLEPFNPEPEKGPNEEGAANSIVNVKTLKIVFNIGEELGAVLSPSISDTTKKQLFDQYREYITNTVMPYLTQMIPSTTILTWDFRDYYGGSNYSEIENVDVTGELEQVPADDVEIVTVLGNLLQFSEDDIEYMNVEGTLIQENDDGYEHVTINGTLTQQEGTTNQVDVITQFSPDDRVSVIVGFDEDMDISVLANFTDDEGVPVLAEFANDTEVPVLVGFDDES